MLTDIRLWRKYFLLCLIRLAQNTIRTTALLFFIMIVSLASTAERFQGLPWEFIMISLGLNWLMMLFFAFKLRRFKAALYPIMFLVNPFMNWIYMVHGIFTAGQRTWGGPRADAAAADAKTTPQQAIEQAIQAGDDLNVIPETFKPAIEARKQRLMHSSLQPSNRAENRFTTNEISAHGMSSGRSSKDDLDMEKALHSRHGSTDISDSEVSIHKPKRIDQLQRSIVS